MKTKRRFSLTVLNEKIKNAYLIPKQEQNSDNKDNNTDTY